MAVWLRVFLIVVFAVNLVQAQLHHKLRIEDEEDELRTLAATSDGKWIVGARYDEIYVWDTSTGEVAERLDYSADNLAINTADAHILLRNNNRNGLNVLERFDIGSQTLKQTEIAFSWKPIQFSTNGKRLLCEHADGGYQIFQYPKMTALLKSRIVVDKRANEVVFSPQGNFVAFIRNGNVETWSVATGKRVARSGAHVSHVESAAFSPDEERLAIVGSVLGREGVGVFNADTLLPIQRKMFARDYAKHVFWSTDGGHLVLLGEDIQFVDPATFDFHVVVPKIYAHKVFDIGGGLIGTTHYKGGPKIWDGAATTRFLGPRTEHTTHPEYDDKESSETKRHLHLVWKPDGSQLAMAFRQPITSEATAQGNSLAMGITGSTRDSVVGTVNRSDQRTQKYVRYEYRVVMIDPKTAKRTQTISVEALPALRDDHADKLLFNGDGSKLGILIKGENIFALWDDKEKRLVTISDETQPDWPYPSDFAFSKSGKTLVLSAKRRCHLYDAQTGMRTGVVKGDFGAALTVLSKSEVLSGFSIWNANPLKLLVQGPDTIPDCFVGNGQCAFSARYLRTRIQRWDLQTLELSELRTESPVASLGLSKDGSLLAAGCRDGIIRVWDANNHRLLVNLKGHQGSVESLDFYPKASILASASRDGKTMLWDLRKVRK
ncbi:WD40 repeat domain-containing protein [Rhodopirellula europaea]|nr:WD40 repeat domain-containing protein [Rhodopirellula europaea]